MASARHGGRAQWGPLMAGSTIADLPTIVLLLIFQRYIVRGVRITGLK